MNHLRKTRLAYNSRKSSKGCPFCADATGERKVIKNKHSYVVPNLTKYDFWELYRVTDHLLLIPYKHVKHLGELGKEAKLEIVDIISKYESKGYSIYARGQGFKSRSVEHQHTHLIKTDNKKSKGALFFEKPYFLARF